MKKRSKHKPDPLRTQISVQVRKGYKVTQGDLRRAVLNQVNTGSTGDPNIRVTMVKWSNPARKTAAGRRTKSSNDPGESVDKAIETLRLKEWLPGRIGDFRKVGPGGGSGASAKAVPGLRPVKNSKSKKRVGSRKGGRSSRSVGAARPNKKGMARGRATARKSHAGGTGGAAKHSRKRQSARGSKPHARAKHRRT